MNIKQTELPDSALVEIIGGFDSRVHELFEEQKDKSLNEMALSGWNEPQRYSYRRIEYAAKNLWFNQNIDTANIALVAYVDYFIKNPGNVLHRDYFHWHSEMALRLIEMFGKNGKRIPGLLKPETENKILEAVWLYCKRMQKNQKEHMLPYAR